VKIGQFLPLLTVKIESNNFSLSNNARQAKFFECGYERLNTCRERVGGVRVGNV